MSLKNSTIGYPFGILEWSNGAILFIKYFDFFSFVSFFFHEPSFVVQHMINVKGVICHTHVI
jgi:hypothetical protein